MYYLATSLSTRIIRVKGARWSRLRARGITIDCGRPPPLIVTNWNSQSYNRMMLYEREIIQE